MGTAAKAAPHFLYWGNTGPMAGKRNDAEWFAGDLFGEIYQAEITAEKRASRIAAFVPGCILAAIASLAAMWLSDQYGMPAILLGLLIGLALNFLSDHPKTGAGLDFVARHGLRAGIILLGLQVTLMQIGDMGWLPFLGLFAIMAASFAAGIAGAAVSGQSRYAGILAGGATAICGASAALALYGVIGKDRLDQARFTVVLVGVALASAIALSAYPALTAMLGLDDVHAGYVIGASIHDAGQAIGGGFAISDTAGAQATIVKLTRIALLAPIVFIVAIWIGSGTAEAGTGGWRKMALPPFIIAFFALVLINSTVSMPDVVRDGGLALSKVLLLLAVTATAMRSRMDLLLEAGWRPMIPVVTASMVSILASLAVALMLAGQGL